MSKSNGSRHHHKISAERLRRFRSLFVAREDAYAIWKGDQIVAVRGPLSDEVLAAHLAGEYRVGTYLIMLDGKTPFLVFDIDEQNRKLVKRILRRLQERSVTAYVERSKSKGFHIWVFVDKPIRAPRARQFAGVVLSGLEKYKIEVFPKQDKVSAEGLGNCIWLPVFLPDVKKERTVFCDDDLEPIQRQWEFLKGIKRVSRKRILRAIEGLKPSKIQRFPRLAKSRDGSEFSLPPCAQTILLKGVEDGHRNIALFTLAKHLRNAEIEQERVEVLVSNANDQCRPPLEERELTGIVKSVFTRGYTSLGCDNTFVASLCGERCPIKRKKIKGRSSIDQILSQVETKPHVHPAQVFHGGRLYYGIKVGRKRHVWVNSDREGFTRDDILERFSLDRFPTKSNWSVSSIRRFLQGGGSVKPHVLFSKLRKFMTRRIHFLAPWQATVVVLWVMGTYVHRIFDWYGYLWLTSPGRRTGKTRLLELISALAYNASSVMTDPTEAALFRDTALNASTQILDEIESLRGADQEKRAALMSMLNDGFKAGAVIPRVNMKAGTIDYHDVFCPRALAGINRLAPTLADRCFRLFLKRKRKEERVARFNQRELASYLQKRRNDLHKFGLLCAPAIARSYENASDFPIPSKVDDRARDILEPLFAIARLLDKHNPDLAVTKQLIEAAKKIARDRAADEGEDEIVVAALDVLSQKFPSYEERWLLRSQEACEILQKHDALEWVAHRRQSSSILRQLGFRSGSHREGKNVFRAYAIKRATLKDLCERYGLVQHD